MPKVILKGHIIIPAAELTVVKKELATHIELTRQESGCLIFEVSQDPEDVCRLNVYEEFVDRESFSNHQNRVRDSKWGTASVNVERHFQVTDIE